MRGWFPGATGKLFDVLAPGLYAWTVTVGWPVSQRFAPLGARIFALVALVTLVAGSTLLFSSPRLARILGIWVFLAACLGTSAWYAPALGPLHFDPVPGILGSGGWALFAISWAGDAATAPSASTPSPPTPSPRPDRDLSARRGRNVPRAAAAVLALVALTAAVPMVLAWWVA